MPEYSGQLRGSGRVAIIVSRYHERITRRLLTGARECCSAAGVPDEDIDVLWVAGAFELGATAAALAAEGDHSCIVALGVVIRGETPHFDFVAGAAARMLAEVSIKEYLPIGFGLLTTDTVEQAAERAGGRHGNKGYEAAEAAITTADLIARIPREN